MQEVPVEASDWEGKAPCAIVPLFWKMAHQSLCRMVRNSPLKILKSLKKTETGPLAKINHCEATQKVMKMTNKVKFYMHIELATLKQRPYRQKRNNKVFSKFYRS